jgi:ribosomal-protein-alanine N-acetyltransferase
VKNPFHQFEIRDLDSSDYFQLKSVLEQVLAGEAPGFNWPWLQVQAELASSRAKALFVDQELLAFVLYRQNQALFEVMTLATVPSQQGQGHMKKLLTELIDASGEGSEWWLEVHANNLKALHLYESLGFEIQTRRKQYYADGGDALLMSLKKVKLFR